MSTYNDLVNSGNLGHITDQRLKELMDKYVDWQIQLAVREEVSKETVWSNYHKYYQANYVKDGRMFRDIRKQNIEGINSYTIDWDRLRKDSEFKRLLTYVIATAFSQKEWTDDTMEQILKIKTHIDNLIGVQ